MGSVKNHTESGTAATGLGDSFGDGQEASTTAGPRRPWRQALLADLRAAIPDASLSLFVTAVFFAYIWWRVEIERSEMVKLMPELANVSSWWDYYLLQAIGWAAWWWAWGTVILGLLVAGGRPRWLPGSTKTIEKLHRTTSLTVIALTLIHILLMFQSRLIQDHYSVWRAFSENFIPLVWGADGGDRTGWWAIGVTGLGAFYLAILLGLSYYFRHRLGVRAWRFAHRFSILVYVLATWHVFLYGSDTWYTGYQRTVLWVTQLPIAFMVLARLLGPLRRSERLPLKPKELLPHLDLMRVLRLGVRLTAVASLVILAGILILDRTGGHQHPDEYPDAEAIEHEQQVEEHGGE